jgi:hypothetical protein
MPFSLSEDKSVAWTQTFLLDVSKSMYVLCMHIIYDTDHIYLDVNMHSYI